MAKVNDKVLAVALAGALGFVGTVIVTSSGDTPRPYYSLIQTLPDGHNYVMDFNLTSGDCVQRRDTSVEVLLDINGAVLPRSLICAEQPDGRIAP